jgi:hypothetical protein
MPILYLNNTYGFITLGEFVMGYCFDTRPKQLLVGGVGLGHEFWLRQPLDPSSAGLLQNCLRFSSLTINILIVSTLGRNNY